MKTFFISDTHFNHKNIIKYENRPFTNVNEMNEHMINAWNAKVTNKDRVYIIGDLLFQYNKEESVKLVKRLNGQKFWIVGNHDKEAIKNKALVEQFGWIKDYYEMKLDDKTLVLFHYPIYSWNKSHYGSIHLYGHVHSNKLGKNPNMPYAENAYNSGVDINGFAPCELEEIIANNIKWIEGVK